METAEVAIQAAGWQQPTILNSTTTEHGEMMPPHRNEARQLGIILVLTNRTITDGTTIPIATETIGVDPMEDSTTEDSAVVVHLDLAVAVELLLAVVAVAEQEEVGTNPGFSNLKIQTNVH
jgi:hypothetical protein